MLYIFHKITLTFVPVRVHTVNLFFVFPTIRKLKLDFIWSTVDLISAYFVLFKTTFPSEVKGHD